MTQLKDLAGSIPLNPEVPFPPFALTLDVPSTWSQLDTSPATWRRSADRLIDSEWRGSRLSARDRRGVFEVLENYVADCQRAGAALSLLTLLRTTAGDPATLGIHLAFVDDGRPATLGKVHDVLGRTGTTSELPTASGPALLHRDSTTMLIPGTGRLAALTNLQLFLPFADTTWTAIVSTASAFPELTDGLERLVRMVVGSMRRSDDVDSDVDSDTDTDTERVPGSIGGAGGQSPGQHAAPGTAFEPAPDVQAPGFARSFGTLVRRRLEPPDGTEATTRESPLG